MNGRTSEGTRIQRFVHVAVLGLCLLVTACGGNMEDPKIQLDPHASMRYEIVARIEGAPDTFESITAAADYQVTNEACVPMKPISGVKIAPTKRISLPLTAVGNGEYRTVVFADRLLDEDYFGKGMCHWSLVASGIIAKKGKTQFSAAIFHDDIIAQGSDVRFYSKNLLTGTLDALDPGDGDRHVYADPSKTFSIGVDAKEMH